MPHESNFEKYKPKLTTDQLREIMELTEKKEEEIIKAKNPENQEIEINLEQERQYWQKFYENHNFKNKIEIPEIRLSAEDIKEIELLTEKGFIDRCAVIPDHLSYQELEKKMTEGYEDTYQGDNFQEDGSFAQLDQQETSKNPQYRLIFFKQAKELKDDKTLKTTLNKSPNQMKEYLNQINKQHKTNLEGISLKEYLIIQRHFTETTETNKNIQNKDRHIDADQWSWCLKSSFPSSGRFVDARWAPADRRLHADAFHASHSSPRWGARLSRSFLLKK